MSGAISRIVVPGLPVGLAPCGRVACEVPLAFPNKNVGDVLDYAVDFSQMLLNSSETAVEEFSVSVLPESAPALIVSENSVDGACAQFWLAGGVAGMSYLVAVTANTAVGRVFTANMALYVLPAPRVGGSGSRCRAPDLI